MTRLRKILLTASAIFLAVLSFAVYRQFFATVRTAPEDAERIKAFKPLSDVRLSEDPPARLFPVFRVVSAESGRNLTFLFKNNTKDHLYYGRDNTFEIELDGEWYYMGSTGHNDIMFELPPKEIRTVQHWVPGDIGWVPRGAEPSGVDWVPGHYRIVKEIFRNSEYGRYGRIIWVVAAEFYME
ncbi:MAG: hypothetical protein LBL09_00850 [Oscillospiraceae bacterium]|jgi:hypothetical protein|nr:hypothetical protein [Oscillospiraceae bacterium]